MTTMAVPGTATVPGGPPGGVPAAGSREPATTGRGRTTVAGRVLERIAVQALSEFDQTGGVARRVWGLRLGADRTGTAPQVRAQVDGQLATMQMTISVVYPAPIRRVTTRLRELVTTRVGQLTGIRLCQLDIDIALLIGPGPTRRQVQ